MIASGATSASALSARSSAPGLPTPAAAALSAAISPHAGAAAAGSGEGGSEARMPAGPAIRRIRVDSPT